MTLTTTTKRAKRGGSTDNESCGSGGGGGGCSPSSAPGSVKLFEYDSRNLPEADKWLYEGVTISMVPQGLLIEAYDESHDVCIELPPAEAKRLIRTFGEVADMIEGTS